MLADKKLTILRRSYIFALMLIMVFACVKYFFLETLILQQENAALLINISGRQRMLSQQIAFFSHVYVSPLQQEDRDNARHRLEKALQEFEKNHEDLIFGNKERGLPVLSHEDILDVYYNQTPSLNSLVRDYIEAGYMIVKGDGQGSDIESSTRYIDQIGPEILIEKLNEIVLLYEKKLRTEVMEITDLQTIFLIITFIILVLEVIFIFKPMERRIKEDFAQLIENKSKIKNQVHELQRFTYIASHDLQEPIRKIIGFSERLEEALGDQTQDKVKNYLGFISSGAKHMRELLYGLHMYAEISSTEEEISEINLNVTMRSVLKSLQELLDSTGSVVEYENLPIIFYDKSMIKVVFENLIDNAVKYRGDKKSYIQISCKELDKEWVISVFDNGIGMEEKYFDRIFEIFQHLHRKEDIPGIGLGLAIVQKIVERHGGKVWVESKPGEGSCFSFSIPKKGKSKNG